jgi:hypothetical protein
MKPNIGKTDKVIRIILGVFVLYEGPTDRIRPCVNGTI